MGSKLVIILIIFQKMAVFIYIYVFYSFLWLNRK